MCGICGRVGRDLRREALFAAMDRLMHRGPDASGWWLGEAAMLGHRRLSVIDLSEAGNQPLSNESGTVQAIFNGEIYNFRELRSDLEHRHLFRSRTDGEVLVHGYEEWGIDGLLNRISGMFAFAVWDDRDSVLYLARDRLGKKPLFYAMGDEGLSFASTLPAVLLLRDSTPSIRHDALRDYLSYMCVPAPKTIIEGVHKLPPAHWAEYRDGNLRLHRYWDLSFTDQDERTEDEWLGLIDAEFQRAVVSRLVSDVPLAVFLSGGIDSSLVTAYAAREVPGGIKTVSARFEDEKFDEGIHAGRVADYLGTDHEEVMIAPDVVGILPRLVFASGEPFGDPALLPLLLLAQKAREKATVVLTGDGGDEGFGGYAGPLVGRAAGMYQRVMPSWLRGGMVPWMAQAGEGLGGVAGGRFRKLRYIAEAGRPREGVRWNYDLLGRKGFQGKTEQVVGESAAHVDDYWGKILAGAPANTAADRILYTELMTHLPDHLLVKTDVATMVWGQEARSPFLDVGLLELAARIPIRVKLRRFRQKYLLRRLAERWLPSDVVRRPKQAFSVPLGQWIRGPLLPLFSALLRSERFDRGFFERQEVERLLQEHKEGRADHGQRLWLLLLFELWARMFIDGDLEPEDDLMDLVGTTRS